MFILKDKLFLAPLAGYSELIFRQIAREYGADITMTEMISVKGINYKQIKTMHLLDSNGLDRPLGAQLFGYEPDDFGQAVQIVSRLPHVDFIDINCGCPVKKVLKQKAGAWLLQEPDRIAAIVKKVKKSTALPVSVKIRIGWTDKDDYLKLSKIIMDSGADFLIVHGRTKDQFFSGEINYKAIEEIKKSVHIPVVGNGNVRDYDTYRKMKDTGCDAVMIGRAAMGNPWIFKNIKDHLIPPISTAEKISIFKKHVDAVITKFTEQKGIRGFRSLGLLYIKNIIAHDRKKLIREYVTIMDKNQMDTFIQKLYDIQE